nr:pre-mRNA-splicing factor SLU7 [Ipomoea batatas]GMD16824.1 pre-mRNA-splicing factor SLU7 [Ipomoea batatas]
MQVLLGDEGSVLPDFSAEPHEKIEQFELDYDGKRDRWNGYDASYVYVVERYEARDEARKKYLKEQQLKYVGDGDVADVEAGLADAGEHADRCWVLMKVTTKPAATPNKHSLLPTRTLVEIKSQPEHGVKATHFHKSQRPPLTQEAETKKCLKGNEPDYYSDEGWAQRFINPGDENIKEGENDCEDIVRYAIIGPVVYPKPFMPANEFYWLLRVNSRDLNGEAFVENVIIQGKIKAKVKYANYKHKARTYHCKEAFIINGDARIVFRKEHVPTKTSHRLSPKRYEYFKGTCGSLKGHSTIGYNHGPEMVEPGVLSSSIVESLRPGCGSIEIYSR